MDLIGYKFGRLTVIGFAGVVNQRNTWLCQCECGGTKTLKRASITGGRPTLSCGCLHRESIGRVCRSHGLSKTTEYRIWSQMIQRCCNPSNPAYPQYGGRGIVVCDEWRTFETFLKDVGKRPGIRYTLDRINNDGIYEPNNVRWATRTQQARNRRSNRTVTIDGVTKTLAEWIEIAPVTSSCVEQRIHHGMEPQLAVTMESKNRHHQKSGRYAKK